MTPPYPSDALTSPSDCTHYAHTDLSRIITEL